MYDTNFRPTIEAMGHDISILLLQFGPNLLRCLTERLSKWYEAYRKNPNDQTLLKEKQKLEALCSEIEKAPWNKNKYCYHGIENLDPILDHIRFVVENGYNLNYALKLYEEDMRRY